MNTKNSYWYFTSAILKQQCQQILDIGEEQLKSQKELGINTDATTFGNKSKNNLKNASSQKDLSIEEIKNLGLDNDNIYVRDSEVTWLTNEWIYDLITPFIQKANQQAGWNFIIDHFENIQFTKYNSPGGFYGWHNDSAGDWHARYKRFIPGITHKDEKLDNVHGRYTLCSDYIGKVRKISMTLNLSMENSYEGGNLKFDFGPHIQGERFKVCEEIRPQGSMVVFPSYEHHCVTPVTRGTRHSLVLWALGAPFK